jgi:Mce-associated membrane protein
MPSLPFVIRRRTAADDTASESAPPPGTGRATGDRGRRVRRTPVVLGVLAVLLGGLAVWFAGEADGVRGRAGAGNVALTDPARTSEVTGQLTDAVNALFSYDYTDAGRTRQAEESLLTGRAIGQYDRMLAQVRAQGRSQRLVLTTTVTDSGVEMLEGDRARLLIFADQRNTRTSGKDTTYAAAMLAVDATLQDGRWKITNVDTLNTGG